MLLTLSMYDPTFPEINIIMSAMKIAIVKDIIFSNVNGLVPKYDNAKDSV